MKVAKGLVAVAVVLLGGSAALAVECEWIGGGENANWSNPANWKDRTVPTASDTVVIKRDADIVIDKDYSAESPAAVSMTVGTANTQTYKVTFSGGHTIVFSTSATTNYKTTFTKCTLEITGAGTKAYFLNTSGDRNGFVNVNGFLRVLDGAYCEVPVANFMNVLVQGKDENGVRSKLKWGKGQNSTVGTCELIADGADIEWMSNGLCEFSFNSLSYDHLFVARNGGTNDMTNVSIGNAAHPDIRAESGGVVLLPEFSPNSTGVPEFTIADGEVSVKTFAPGVNNTTTDMRKMTLKFSGDNPRLVSRNDLGESGASITLGKVNYASVDIYLEPTVAWANHPGLISQKSTAANWGAYATLTESVNITIDVSKLPRTMHKGTMTFPLIHMDDKSYNGIVGTPVLPITLTGENAENYTAVAVPKPNGNKRLYNIELTKLRTGTGLTVFVK